ncbi:MAG: hypothetical protein ACOC9N_00390 [Gemmatimonadota bacterium]
MRRLALPFTVRRASTRETIEIYGQDRSSSRWAAFRAASLVLALLVVVSACDYEWGGATVALINPAPAPEPESADGEADPGEAIEPLPRGELVYLVRLDPLDPTAASVVPVARMVEGSLAGLELPEEIDSAYRARFDSAFYAPDAEMPLHAGGHRIGSLVIEGSGSGTDTRCPSVGIARVLLPPGASPPEFAFARAGEDAFGLPAPYDRPAADDRMRTFGPVLAENLLRAGGENRPYLAQRASLRAVPWPGDERPAIAATYFVNDRLEDAPPENAASSLFFLARFDGRQYVAEWSEVRRYQDGEGKEAFVYFGALGGPRGRIDFATRHDGGAVRLVASVDRTEDERTIDWTEPARCPSVSQLAPVRAPDTAATAASPGG